MYAEDLSWARQLASAARNLGEDIAAFTTNPDIADELTKYYPKVYYAIIDVFEPLSVAKTVRKIIDADKPEIMLLPCTNKGRMLTGLLSSYMNSVPVTDAVKISFTGDTVEVDKITFGGNAIAKVAAKIPVTICLSVGAYPEAEPLEKPGEAVRVEAEKPAIKTSFQPRKAEGITPDKADIVVGAGRGIKRKEDLSMIEELAKILKGAWSVTRPLAADYGWADNWIGISGLIISPKLYIAVGISGQAYHMIGVKGAKIIVAINNDENAPIFEEADYGIVGDLYKVLPVLINKLKERGK